jgi:hypothetical protein
MPKKEYDNQRKNYGKNLEVLSTLVNDLKKHYL